MKKSMFKNFNPERIKNSFDSMTPFGSVPNLHFLISKAIELCRPWEDESGVREKKKFKNKDFSELYAGLTELADIGFNNRNKLPFWESDERYCFKKFTTVDWARCGYMIDESFPMTFSQINGIGALWMIDRAMTRATSEGITLNFIEDLSMVSIYMLDASECSTESMSNFLIPFMPNALAEYFSRKQSENASQRARSRHAVNNDAKKFVRLEWRKYKDEYKNNKSEFSRIYVRRVKNEFGVEITEKQMREVWLADTPSTRKQAG